MNSHHTTVFRITLQDFECLLGRSLNYEEKVLIQNKFCLDDWSERAIEFMELNNINLERNDNDYR